MNSSLMCAGLVILAASVAMADKVLTSEAVRTQIERCAQFEHAQDRREALDALRNRSGLTCEAWADVLFTVATNRNNRFILSDTARYASTNQLARYRLIASDASQSASFRQAAFRVYATIDGFGTNTVSLVDDMTQKRESNDGLSVRRLLLQAQSLLPTNDIRRTVFERRLQKLKTDGVR